MITMDSSIFVHILLDVCFLSLQVNFVCGRIPKSTSEIEGYLFNCFPCSTVLSVAFYHPLMPCFCVVWYARTFLEG